MANAVFFDVDGVLLDTISAKGEAFADAFRGYPDKRSEIIELHVRNGGIPRDRKIEMILEEVFQVPVTQAEVSRLVAQFAATVVARVHACPEVSGASAALAALSSSRSLHAVSATPESELRGILEARGWTNLFRSIHGIPPSKGTTLQKLIERFEYDPADCFMIGDSSQDRVAAQENGIPFIYISADLSSALPEDVAVLADLVSLPEVVRAGSRMSS